MKRILKIGMDVHTSNYTFCAMEPVIGEEDRVFATIKVTPDYKNILMFIADLNLNLVWIMNMTFNVVMRPDVLAIHFITS